MEAQIMNSLSALDPLKVQAGVIAKPALELKVKDEASQLVATGMLKDIKGLLVQIDDQRTLIVKPHNDYVKRVNTYAKDISEQLVRAETSLKGELRARAAELERVRMEEQKRAEAERLQREKEIREKAEAEKAAAANDFDALLAPPEQVAEKEAVREVAVERELKAAAEQHAATSKTIASMKVAGTRKVWKFEITDVSQIPREYLVVDESAIRKAMMAGVRDIAGVRIFEDVVIAAGR